MTDSAVPQTLGEHLKVLSEKATPGPWVAWNAWDVAQGMVALKRIGPSTVDTSMGIVAAMGGRDADFYAPKADVELVCALRNAVPEILAALGRAAPSAPLPNVRPGSELPWRVDYDARPDGGPPQILDANDKTVCFLSSRSILKDGSELDAEYIVALANRAGASLPDPERRGP